MNEQFTKSVLGASKANKFSYVEESCSFTLIKIKKIDFWIFMCIFRIDYKVLVMTFFHLVCSTIVHKTVSIRLNVLNKPYYRNINKNVHFKCWRQLTLNAQFDFGTVGRKKERERKLHSKQNDVFHSIYLYFLWNKTIMQILS